MSSPKENFLRWLERWRQFATHDVWRIGAPGEQIPHGFLIKQIRVMILLMQGLVRDALLLRASALAFTTLLSLVPLLIVMVYIVQSFDLQDQIKDFIKSQVFRGIAQDSGGDAPAIVLDGQSFANPVDILFDFAERGSNPKTLGVWGVLFVVFTVFGLMNNIESSFNQIWGIKRMRSIYRMASDYMMVMLLLPFLAAGMLSSTAILKSTLLEYQYLQRYLIWASNYAIVWLAFTALYVFVPNTRVKIPYAFLGGVVAGTLWNLASWAYVTFQFGILRYKLIYLTLAQAPLLLAWIFISWVILLFGAELAFAYQNEKTFAMERLAAGASHAYREAVALRAMLEMAWRFDTGAPGLETAHAGEAWNVPTRLINETIDQLERAGLVRRCATEPATFQPARSINKITLGDIVHALREAGRDPSAFREDTVFRSLLDALQDTGGGALHRTLAEAIQDERLRPTLAME